MARRPHLEQLAMHVLVPRGNAGIWQVIKTLAAERETFTVVDVDGRMNSHRDTVRDYVQRLERAGYLALDRIEHGNPPRRVYRLVRTARDAPRLRRDGTELPETAQDTLWRTIKMLKRFTVSALIAAAGSETRVIPRVTAHRYVRQLAEVGVLSRPFAGGPATEAEFMLVRNLGGEAPKILRTHLVFDPNSNTVLGSPKAKVLA
jgi:hypothetical protein